MDHKKVTKKSYFVKIRSLLSILTSFLHLREWKNWVGFQTDNMKQEIYITASRHISWLVKLCENRLFHKRTKRLTQHWPHTPHPGKHRGACVCVRLALVCLCTKGHWRESSISDWISWTLAEHSQGKEGKAAKAECITLPKQLEKTSHRQTGWRWACRPNFI